MTRRDLLLIAAFGLIAVAALLLARLLPSHYADGLLLASGCWGTLAISKLDSLLDRLQMLDTLRRDLHKQRTLLRYFCLHRGNPTYQARVDGHNACVARYNALRPWFVSKEAFL